MSTDTGSKKKGVLALCKFIFGTLPEREFSDQEIENLEQKFLSLLKDFPQREGDSIRGWFAIGCSRRYLAQEIAEDLGITQGEVLSYAISAVLELGKKISEKTLEEFLAEI